MTAEEKAIEKACEILHGVWFQDELSVYKAINRLSDYILSQQYNKDLLSKVDELEKENEKLKNLMINDSKTIEMFSNAIISNHEVITDLQSQLQASQQMNERLIEGYKQISNRLNTIKEWLNTDPYADAEAALNSIEKAKEFINKQLLSSFNKEGGEG